MRHVPTSALACALLMVPCAALAQQDPHDPQHGAESTDVDPTRERIVVTATPLERTGDQLAVPTHALGREQVLSHLGSTLGETLGREPGITSSGFSAGASRPVIRGQDALRVQILEDGVGSHDVSDVSPDHGVPGNPLVAQRIEVVRGPAALRHGGGASGGVVSTLTNRVPRELPAHAVGGELFAGYGTVARQRDVAGILEGALGRIGWHVDAASRDANDYRIGGRGGARQRGTDTDGHALSLGAAWIGEGFRIGAARARFANVYGIPEQGEKVSIDLARDAWLIEADWDAPATGIEALTVRAGLSDYEHDEIAAGHVAARFRNDEDEVRVELLHAPVLGLSGALGVHHAAREFRGLGEAADFLLPMESRQIAAYVFEELALSDRVQVQLGARVEHSEARGTPFGGERRAERFTPLSGSVGLLLRLGDALSAGLTLSAQERAPAPVELFARGPHEATGTFEIGDAGLSTERSRGVDLALRLRHPAFRGELSLFYTDFEDYVFGELTGRTCDEAGACLPGPGAELDELLYRQRDATFYGAELSGSIELLDLAGGHLGCDFQADFVRARFQRGGNLPRVPPLRYGAGLHYARGRMRARLGVLRTTTQHRSAAGESDTRGHSFVDALLAFTLASRSGDHGLELIVAADNLLDSEGRNHVSFRKAELILPGRNVRVALHLRF